MKHIHRIGLNAVGERRSALEKLGLLDGAISFPSSDLVAFDIDEDDPRWPAVRELVAAWRASDVVDTKFNARELAQAEWLELTAWHHGYPQPDEGNAGYLQATYDLRSWCEACGVGKTQKSHFEMKAEPVWGRHGAMQLIWVYDEVFVTPVVWKEHFNPFGVSCRPVLGPRGRTLTTVVQLVAEATVSVEVDGLPSETCGTCGRVKYLPVARGFFPALRATPKPALVRTNEWFGSGGKANQRLVIANALATRLREHRVKGIVLRPAAARTT